MVSTGCHNEGSCSHPGSIMDGHRNRESKPIGRAVISTYAVNNHRHTHISYKSSNGFALKEVNKSISQRFY